MQVEKPPAHKGVHSVPPPPHTLHRPPRRQAQTAASVRGTRGGQCTHINSKTPSDEGGMRAREGTRTPFPPLKTPGTRENMRNPKQFAGDTRHSDTKSVDSNPHPAFGGAGGLPVHQMPGNLGSRVQQVDVARRDSADEAEALVRGETT